MKRSSLLALSLVALLGLTGCNKKALNKVSAEQFDAKIDSINEGLEEKYAEDPTYDPFDYYGLLTYSYNEKRTGTFVSEENPSGVTKVTKKFHIVYTNSWEPYPVEGDSAGHGENGAWTDEDYADANEIIFTAFILDGLLFNPGFAAGIEEEYADDETVKYSFYLNPFRFDFSSKESGEDEYNRGSEGEAEMATYNWIYNIKTSVVWNSIGELTSFKRDVEIKDDYPQDPQLNRSRTAKESYTVKYLPLPGDLLK